MKLKIIFVLFLFSSLSYAQLSDLARIDYTILPAGNSDIEYTRVRGLFNYPIKLKKEDTYLLLGLDYSNIQLTMDDNPFFDKEGIRDFKLLDLSIGYTTPLKNGWRLGVRLTPGFGSNLATNDLTINGIVISSDVVFIKDKRKDPNIEKPWSLILGVSYSENRGFPFPLPFISYYKKFHSKWSYNIGIPKINLEYHASSKHKFKLNTEIDGFTSNIQRGVVVNNIEEAESINMSLVLTGLQYDFNFTKHLQFYAKAMYVLSSAVKLRNDAKDDILELDSSNSSYIRTGIRFKI